MLAASAAFAVMVVSVRAASRSLPWAEVAAFRAAVGTLVAGAAVRLHRVPFGLWASGPAWGRSGFGALAMAGMFYAFSQPDLPLGDVATLRATAPFVVAGLGWLFLKETPGRRVALGLPVAFVGVAVMLQPRFEAGWDLALWVLAATSASAVATLFLRRLRDHPPDAVAFQFGVVATVVLGSLAVPDLAWPDGPGLGFGVLAGVAGGVGQLCLTRAYRWDHAGKVAAVSFSSVILVQVFGAIVLREWPGREQLVGSGLVIAAGLILVWPRSKTAPA